MSPRSPNAARSFGGQASIATGSAGRNLSAETDYKLGAEIYSGTKWEIDARADKAVYGKDQAGDVGRLLGRSGSGGPN